MIPIPPDISVKGITLTQMRKVYCIYYIQFDFIPCSY